MKSRITLALTIAFWLAVFVLGPMYLRTPYNYLSAFAALLFMVVSVGQHVTGRLLGVLVTERNTMSLTRFQSLLWTLLIAAAFATLVFARINAKAPTADIAGKNLTPELLALMGVSYASAVGAGLVNGNKATKTPSQDAVDKSKTINGDQAAVPTDVLYCNKTIKDAALTDIFEGDEVADAHMVDLGKVQMFFFTIVGAVVFIAEMVNGLLLHATDIAGFTIPPVDKNLIALMGISHAAYLGTKTQTKTKEAQPGDEDQAPAPAPFDAASDPTVQGIVGDVNTIKGTVAELSAAKSSWITNDAMVAYVDGKLPPPTPGTNQ